MREELIRLADEYAKAVGMSAHGPMTAENVMPATNLRAAFIAALDRLLGAQCATCKGSGKIWVAVDGEVACPECGYAAPPTQAARENAIKLAEAFDRHAEKQ